MIFRFGNGVFPHFCVVKLKYLAKHSKVPIDCVSHEGRSNLRQHPTGGMYSLFAAIDPEKSASEVKQDVQFFNAEFGKTPTGNNPIFQLMAYTHLVKSYDLKLWKVSCPVHKAVNNSFICYSLSLQGYHPHQCLRPWCPL